MANPWDILMGDTQDAKASAAAMAAQLRQQRQMAILAALGDRKDPIGALGGLQQGWERGDQEDLNRNVATRARIGEERSARTQEAAMALERLRQEGRMAQLLAGLAGKEALAKLKGKETRPFSAGEAKRLGDANKMLANVKSLRDEFTKAYVPSIGGPPAEWQVGFEQKLGSWATPGAQKRANFWTRKAGLIDLLKRHEFFGSAFTDPEQRAYKAADQLQASKDPESIKAAFNEMIASMDELLSAHGEGRSLEGFSREAAAKYLKDTTFAKGVRGAAGGEAGQQEAGEGTIADGPNGQQLILKNGAWVPLNR